ncbi:MAG: hypothetical protein LH481_00575 [Burkholderiales bacterium]|nr:hypothetical protein [Burkholderiales bacterium]
MLERKYERLKMEIIRTYYLGVIAPTSFILLSLFFMGAALKIIVGRRPVVLNLRYFFVAACLILIPNLFAPLIFKVSQGNFDLIFCLGSLMTIGVLALLWIQWKGRLVIGISGENFKESFSAAGEKLGLTFEECLGGFRIKESGEVIRVSLHGWLATAQIQKTGKMSMNTFLGLVQGMVAHHTSSNMKARVLTPWICFLIGVGLLLASANLIGNISKLGNPVRTAPTQIGTMPSVSLPLAANLY